MVTFILALALQCVFPLFDSGPGEFVGVSVVNTDTQPREFTVTATPSDGGAASAGRITVQADGQRARLLSELLDNGTTPSGGWLRIESAVDGCPAYLTAGDSDKLLGIEPASSLSGVVLLPHIEVNTGFMELNASDTTVLVVNPGAVDTTVTAEFVELNGNTRLAWMLSVPAGGSRQFRSSDPLGNVLPGNGAGGITFQGYIRLTSASAGIAAWQRIDTPLSSSILRGRGVEELGFTSQAMLPHFVFGAEYGSTLNLINPGQTPVSLDFSAHDGQGNEIGETIRVVLQPGEGRRSSVGEFFRVVLIQIYPQPLISGYVRIRESSGQPFQVVGNIEIFGVSLAAHGSSMLSPVQTESATDWLLPFGTSGEAYFTGYSIVAANELLAAQTDVTVEFLDSAGQVVRTITSSISPRGRVAAMLPEGLASGYLRVKSNLPIYILGSIGSRNCRTLDEVPAIRRQ